MPKVIDLTGKRFGLWTVLSRQGSDRYNNAKWLCRCDCGKERTVCSASLRNDKSLSCGCIKKATASRGPSRPNWKGGRTIDRGYVVLANSIANCPRRDDIKTGSTFEHVAVMARHLGRPIQKHETVHHKNGVRDDNRLENLELWSRSQPAGQRVSDKVAHAKEILETYEPKLAWVNDGPNW